MDAFNKHEREIIGVDEAGRGSLAGPVVAAAVVLPQNYFPMGGAFVIRDSKKMTPAQREQAYEMLTGDPTVAWATGIVSETVIDEMNIREAALLAMKQAVEHLLKKMGTKEFFLVVDGSDLLYLPARSKASAGKPITQFALHKADDLVPCCSAASIIAKVTRDRLMERAHATYPLYGFDAHKGYGTKLHLAQLRRHGPCPIHRKTFAPVAKLA